MKNTISILFLATFAFIVTLSTSGCIHHKRGPNYERMSKKLSLSEQQNIEFQKIMSIKQNAMKEFLKQHHDSTVNELSSVLSEEQLNNYKELSSRRFKHMN